MKVLITRNPEGNKQLKNLLEQNGIETLEYSCIEFVAPDDNYKGLDTAIRKNHEYDWIFLLSKTAAQAFFERLLEIGGNLFNLSAHLKLACVGKSTKDYIEGTIGFPVDFMPSKFNTNDFFKEFEQTIIDKRDPSAAAIKVLLPRTKVQDNSFVESLEKAKVQVHAVDAYKTICPKNKNNLNPSKDLAISFTSSEIVRNFKRLQPNLDIEKHTIFSIGPKTSQTIREEYPQINDFIEARESTLEGLVSTIKDQQS